MRLEFHRGWGPPRFERASDQEQHIKHAEAFQASASLPETAKLAFGGSDPALLCLRATAGWRRDIQSGHVSSFTKRLPEEVRRGAAEGPVTIFLVMRAYGSPVALTHATTGSVTTVCAASILIGTP